jgi:hypothetical protein
MILFAIVLAIAPLVLDVGVVSRDGLRGAPQLHRILLRASRVNLTLRQSISHPKYFLTF